MITPETEQQFVDGLKTVGTLSLAGKYVDPATAQRFTLAAAEVYQSFAELRSRQRTAAVDIGALFRDALRQPRPEQGPRLARS